MEIVFKNARMKEDSEDLRCLSRKYGKLQASKISARLNELDAAESLDDIWKLPHVRLHALSGKLKGNFAIDIKHPYRIIFFPLNGDTANLKTVTKIQISALCHGYH